MLLVAFHFGSEEFRRCPGCVAACTRMSHLAAPIGKDWANLTQPEQRFRPGLATPHFSGRSLVPTWRALKSELRLRVWATAARIGGWGASMPQNLRLRSLVHLWVGTGNTVCSHLAD